MITISHNINEETLEAKAKWFSSLSYAERMDLLCEFTDLILEMAHIGFQSLKI
jgi:hypothetical protein